jgi:hypothetical protein
MGKVDDPCHEGLQGTATDDNAVQRHKRDFKRGSAQTNNLSRASCHKPELRDKAWINQAL